MIKNTNYKIIFLGNIGIMDENGYDEIEFIRKLLNEVRDDYYEILSKLDEISDDYIETELDGEYKKIIDTIRGIHELNEL